MSSEVSLNRPVEGDASRASASRRWQGMHPSPGNGAGQQSQTGAPSTAWTIKELVLLLTLAVCTFSIVSFPKIPVSPIVFLPFLLLIVCISDIRRAAPLVMKNPLFLLFLALSFLQEADILARYGFDYEAIAKSGRLIAASVLCLSVVSYILGGFGERYRRVLAIFLVLLSISVLWFLCEITLIEPFVSLRLRLYADIYDSLFQGDEGDFTRSGLSPFLHHLGYQLTFLLSILLVLQTQNLQRNHRFYQMIVLVVGFTALYFSAQRSAFFAVALTVGIFFFYLRNIRKGLLLLLLLPVIFGGLLAITRAGSFETDYLQVSVVQKLLRPEHWSEAIFRLQLQWRAIELVYIYPLGLPDLGGWIEEGFWPVFVESGIPSISAPIAVHNSYLGVALECGMPFLLLSIVFLYQLMRTVHRTLKWSLARPSDGAIFTQAALAAAPGLFLLQSATHNSSLFTQDVSCLIMFCLVVVADIRRRSSIRLAS